jgi:flagellar hook-associated protein 2
MAEVSATDNIGSSLIKSMNVGSGVDISELAEALANADTAPSIATKTTQKDDATAAISGLGILKSSLSNFSQSVDTMTDKSSLTDKSATSQNTDRLEVKITAQSAVQAGTHKFHCRQLARSQINELKMQSGSFTSDSQALNGGSSFNLSIASPAGGSATTVAVSTATPAGIVDAINAANVNGIRAYTMNMASSGTAISIMIEGKTGVANTFTVTDASSISSPSTLITQDTSNDIQAAADLKLVVNKPSDTSEFVFRDNNSPSDVIAGVQLNFKVADNSDPYTTTNIVIAEDRAAFTTAMTNMQTAYNDLVQTIGVLDGSVESESSYAGNLKKEKSTLRGIVQNIRTALTNDSSTPSDPINSMRQLGVGFDLNGNLTIQRTTLDAAVISNFSDITKMLTANTDDQSSFSSAAKGLAQDVVNVVDNFNGVSGIVSIKTDSNTKLVRDLTTQLEDLQSKYESSRKRYLQQFAAMESLVQSSKSTGDYLTQQFKAMNGDN